jgi:molybdopterin-containing oxidoreductase family iron-sulfur binding subunit
VQYNRTDKRWGMAIDLSSCIGCNSCVAACYAENNVAIVGKENMARGREMAWLRIERYYEDTPLGVETRFAPMLCQHCSSAPCETVCPVYATYHNPEGLNVQVYNRCVGTRYCSNNCPYKVRAFNWFGYEFPSPLNWQLNPDVSVRSKGVMEKCTFCVQRIRAARDLARDENRDLRDGDVVSACAQACPTRAIVFGDLGDPASEVSRLARGARGYRVFESLNTLPAITYLKKVSRRAPAETAGEHGEA